MVPKLYVQLSCLLILMSSSYILGAEQWTIAMCNNVCIGIPTDISNLPVSYVDNSKMAALTAHSGVTYKVSEDFGYDARVLDSNNQTLSRCTIGQILNSNPFQPPRAGNPSNQAFWQSFIAGLTLPYLTLGFGAICAAYNININIKNIDMRTWFAFATAAGAGTTALYGLYNICFGNSNRACKNDIARMSASLLARDKSDPKKWLRDRSFETGIAELFATSSSVGSSQDQQLFAQRNNELQAALSSNAVNVQIALNALQELPARNFEAEAQRFYAQAFRMENYGRIISSSSAAVLALFLGMRAGK